MINKSPAFQFYPDDWNNDINVIVMSPEEEGHYIRLCGLYWKEGSLPADPEEVQSLLKKPCKSLEKILKCFYKNPKDNSQLLHKRLEKERKKQKAWRIKCAKGGRKSRKKKGFTEEKKDKGSLTNPISKTEVNDNSIVSISDSVSNSKSKDKTLVGEGKETETLNYLNQKTGKAYKPTASNLKFISGRFNEGYSGEDFKRVIDCKTEQWGGDRKMDKYLRPATLFNASKFAGYVNEMEPAKPKGEDPYIPPEPPKPRVPGDPILEKFWCDTLEKIKEDILPASYDTWFKNTFPASLSKGLLTVSVPNQFSRKMMIENYRPLIESTLSNIKGNPVLVEFNIAGR